MNASSEKGGPRKIPILCWMKREIAKDEENAEILKAFIAYL